MVSDFRGSLQNYSRGRVTFLDKRVKLLNKFFYDIIDIKNVLTQLVIA